MVKVIKIVVPETTEKLEYLQKILVDCAIKPNNRADKPTIVFETQKDVLNPTVSFDDEEKDSDQFWVGKMEVGFNLKKTDKKEIKSTGPELDILEDKFGQYLKVKWPNTSYYQLNFDLLYQRLRGHIVSLDHAGINIHPKIIEFGEFDRLINKLAKSSEVITYPTNDNWYFVVPEARETGPYFELVGDFKYKYPELQIDIQTDLTPKKVIEMFPQPYGYYDSNPKTGDYCVSVFMYTGWNDTSLRVDIRFKVDKPNWKERFVREGKRVE
ncbi:MAG: hypothetical protein WCT01_04220 [Candidatus Shapirobacteria bacterium]|jgi:hypothetical protein